MIEKQHPMRIAIEKWKTTLWRQSPERSATQSLLPVGLSVCAAVLFLWQTTSLFRLFPGHDQSWYLTGADRLLHGAQLYGPQFLDTNPPLILWLSTLPVLLAKVSPLSSTSALRLITLILIGACAWWCTSLVRRQNRDANGKLLLPFAVAVVGSALSIDLYDFGQRDHLTFLCLLPYILAAVADDFVAPFELVLIGAVAGLGVCLKPHQLITVVVFEAFILVSSRSLRRLYRPTVLALLVTLVSYLAAVRLAAPLYLKLLPILVNSYWAYGPASFGELAKLGAKIFVYTVLAAAYLRWRGKDSLFPRYILFLLVASLGAHVAFSVQHTGWAYQAFPSFGLQHLAIRLWAVDLLWLYLLQSNRRVQVFAVAILGVYCTLVVVRLVRSSVFLGGWDRPYVEALLKDQPAGESVTYLSMSGVAMSDVQQHQLTMGTRFFHLWMLPAIAQNIHRPPPGSTTFKHLDAETIQNLSDMQRNGLAEDLERWRPKLVLVELCTAIHPCPEAGPDPLDTVAWLSANGHFAQQWAKYHKIAGNVAYEAYERTE